ncbi:neprilysin-1-like [Haemaphysalis longicornis]
MNRDEADHSMSGLEGRKWLFKWSPFAEPSSSHSDEERKEPVHASPSSTSSPQRSSRPRGLTPIATWSSHERTPSRAAPLAGIGKRMVASLGILALVTLAAAFLSFLARYWVYGRGRPQALALLCRSETCSRYEELLASAKNPEANPCDDFYAHVCGTWTSTGKRPVYQMNWDRFMVEIAKRTLSLKPGSGKNQRAVDKVVTYVQACLSPLERDNMLEVKSALASAGLPWPDPSPQPDFLAAMFHMSRRIYQPLFVGVYVISMQGPRTLMLSYDSQFASTYERISRHVSTIHAKAHFRASYESLAPMNETRFNELFDDFISMKWFLDKHLPQSDDGNSSKDLSFLLQLTPAVTRSRWDALSRRYLNSSLKNMTGVFVDHVASLRVLFKLHQEYGEEKMADFVGWFGVQALVGFSNARLLASFHGSADVATEEQRKTCVTTAYQTFAYAIDSFLREGMEQAVKDVHMLVQRVGVALQRLLAAGAKRSSLLLGDPKPKPDSLNLRRTFAILNASKREVFDHVYGSFPLMLEDAPLRNSIAVAEHLHKNVDALGDQQPYTGAQALDATLFDGFRLNPQLLVFPWYEADAPLGVLLGGLGMRLAAASVYDYLERSGRDLHLDNVRCLAPNATSADMGTDLLGAVAATAVVWEVYMEAKRSSDAALSRENPPSYAPDRMVFAFHCWLYCGDAERGPLMCNTPMMHSRDFAFAYGCPVGARMNPADKCQIKV